MELANPLPFERFQDLVKSLPLIMYGPERVLLIERKNSSLA